MFGYGKIGLATATESHDYDGSIYSLYTLTREQFYIYHFLISFIAALLIFFQLKYIIQDNPKSLTKTFWALAIFILVLLLSDHYIETNYAFRI